ncbi:MAG: DUF3795 domain-containing protein [Bacilli bacterium]|nr:DUF3795 domain-containing protein [Bacilli bacterium]
MLNFKKIKNPKIGVCGLYCGLCPAYVSKGKSRCQGCKTEWRFGGPCSILHCAAKKDIEFCGNCKDKETCEKWQKHRDASKNYDSFKCYQRLEADILYIEKYGMTKYMQGQEIREKLLLKMLEEYNDGRSKSYYCIVATIFKIDEIEKALNKVSKEITGLTIKEKAKLLHLAFDEIAAKKGYCLKLRKKI